MKLFSLMLVIEGVNMNASIVMPRVESVMWLSDIVVYCAVVIWIPREPDIVKNDSVQ